MKINVHRNTIHTRRRGRAYADMKNEKMKEYQKTFLGYLALSAGRVNTGAKTRGVQAKITANDLHEIWMRQNGLSGSCGCASCGREIKQGEWHVDHIVPLMKNGIHHPSNLQIICEDCHKVKTRGERDVYKTGQAEISFPSNPGVHPSPAASDGVGGATRCSTIGCKP